MNIALNLNDGLRKQLSRHLAAFPVQSAPTDEHRHAAVALAVVNQRQEAGIGNIPFRAEDSGRAALILTIRASKLRDHAGQRAFPGGRIDPGETAEQAALRELGEEVGLHLDSEAVLGRLDDYVTRSGFVITPVVVWGGETGALEACPEEVETIHRIPLDELMRDDAPILEPTRDNRHPVLKMPLGNDWVAAPTGAVAYQFREVALAGRHTRVAHFEQPVWAWK